jgi:chromosome segregation ATPase
MSISDKLDEIIEKLNHLEIRMKLIEDQLSLVIDNEEKLEKTINGNTEDCKKMSDHIDFIHNVYTSLRSPLNFITSRFTSRQEELPYIE